MKHLFKITFIALFLAQLSMAQTSRFVYQVMMKSDSTDKANATIETARLDISPEKSLFYGEGRIKRDSVMQRMRETRNFDRNAMQNLRSSIDYIVEKDLIKNITYFKTRLGRDQYTYEEDRKMDWKILPETVKIGEYEAQKAETTFAGRKWYAWFTQDIPFQDGPYKFKGLPGLIVKLEDATQSHVFELKAVGKYKEEIQKVSEFVGNDKYIEVNQEQYKKIFLEDRNDPAKSMKMAMANGAVLQFRDQNGNEISTSEMIKRREQQVKENNKRDNNLLELDLLQ